MAITEEQRRARKGGIFSSDVPKIMAGQGVRVYLQKLGELEEDQISELEYVQLGNLLEPAVLDAYSLTCGPLKRNLDTLRHERLPWLGAHLDALRPGPLVVEAKAVGVYNRKLWGDPGTDEIPDRVLWQVQAQMAVSGALKAEVPVVFATEEALTRFITTSTVPIEIYVVHRSEILIEQLISQADMVWSAVQARIPPKPVTVEDARLLYTRDTGEAIQANDLVATWVGHLKAHRLEMDRIAEKEEACKAEIMAYMGNASELRIAGQTSVTWKSTKDVTRFDVDEFKKQLPGIYQQYVIQKPGHRRFLVK